MRYVAIDVETTGLSERCGLLELAMVAEDTTQPFLVEDLPYFRALFWPPDAVWEPFAMKMHRANGLLDEILSAERRDGEYAWEVLRCWLRGNDTHGPYGDVESVPLHAPLLSIPGTEPQLPKIVAAGKNFAGFDKRFIGPIAKHFDYRSIDPGSVFVDWSKDRLPGLADLVPPSGLAKHRALDDARDVVLALRRSYDRARP